MDQRKLNCSREVLNFSSIERSDRFDKKTFNPDRFIEKLSVSSPNMLTLLNKIEELDKNDILKHGKLFKHFIFSDIRRGYGAKVIASGFIAAGYTIAITSISGKIVVDQSVIDSKNESKFLVLSSTSIWESIPTPDTTKKILDVFNKRPENVYGNYARFIIIDSGFKEGVDLFDVKYAHIFEDQLSEADLTQAIGRGTRFCGQSGLRFNKGWPLYVFNYKISQGNLSLLQKALFRKKKSVLKLIRNTPDTTSEILKAMKENALDIKLTNKNKQISEYNFELIAFSLLSAAALTIGVIKYRSELNKKNSI
jgi:hypothetical protein